MRVPKFFIKHKTDIMFIGGVGLILAGTVGACFATFKAKDEVEKLDEELEKLDEKKDEMDEAEYNKEVTWTWGRTILKIGALYIGPAIFEGTGIALCTKSYKDMKETALNLGAAFTATCRDFKNYRKNVTDDLGKEADLKYRYGIRETEFEETDEAGNTTCKSAMVMDPVTGYSIHAKIFDEGCKAWTKDPEENMAYLITAQKVLTDTLRSRGYLFLNDVYDYLGIPRTAIGQQVGWCMGLGDGYVDFGLHQIYRKSNKIDQAKVNFINGYERCVMLDFNLDGSIINIFHKYSRV